MSDFILGPLWSFSIFVFCLGAVGRILMILRSGQRPDFTAARGSKGAGAAGTIFRRFLPRRQTLHTNRLQIIAGYMFHLGLLVVLFFAAPHVAFLKNHLLGFGWSALPHWAFVIAAEISFAGLILLWLHRVMHPVTRLLTRLDDHLAAGLTFFAMFTGCLALFESYLGLRVLHVFSVELLMLYFPFSHLMHAFTFVLSRGSTGAAAGRQGVKA